MIALEDITNQYGVSVTRSLFSNEIILTKNYARRIINGDDLYSCRNGKAISLEDSIETIKNHLQILLDKTPVNEHFEEFSNYFGE